MLGGKIMIISSLCIWLLSLIQIRFTPNRILVQLSSKSIATKSASQMTTVRYEYDVIFIGSGTAVCVAAGRLIRKFPDLQILIIERGRDSLADPTIEPPALIMTHLMPDSTTALVCDVKIASNPNVENLVVVLSLKGFR